MNSLDTALLLNLIGFTVGIALYAMLGIMILRSAGGGAGASRLLLPATAVLGLIWNLGEFASFIQRDIGTVGESRLLAAASYSALGFLPSVVVHSALIGGSRSVWLAYAAYSLSSVAAVLHFYAAFTGGSIPSGPALIALTIGSVTLAAGLLFLNFRRTLEKKAFWGAALLVFAVSALHLSGPGDENSLPVELIAHQSSLPIALVILYQNYRFAFADLFLKRAISLIFLAVAAFALYVFAALPLLGLHEGHAPDDMQATSVIITFWIATALAYPFLHRAAVWLVDRVILKRTDYAELQVRIANEIESLETGEAVLDVVTREIGRAFTAEEAKWHETHEQPDLALSVLVSMERDQATILIPTNEAPFYEITLGGFYGGRRLLSDESAMLDAVSLIAARRIDALRVSHERCDQEFREQEFSKLATEAQLAALRSQINPHFLFNALTTIGYLIQTSPDKAFQTLIHLTKLLRAVLSSTGEFSKLGDELKLIRSYLDIERARFEERLEVTIDVPEALAEIHLPALILQPLVENAIKHGISENPKGGEIRITACLDNIDKRPILNISVFDTGNGRSAIVSNKNGVGLKNVRERLAAYYGTHAGLEIEATEDGGTRSGICIPVEERSN
jgi:hypothetical protein